jgi:hypothetical protein
LAIESTVSMDNATLLFVSIAGGLGVVAFFLLIAALFAIRRRRPLGFTLRLVLALAFFGLAAFAASLGVAVIGYQALTQEETAARVLVQPTAPQEFAARFRFPDGREVSYALKGDQIYVDARILKWKPIANIVGLHTAYDLDRVAGRYSALEKERSAPRTVHSLSADKPLDIFDLRTRYAALAPLLDVEYGSATFAPADQPAEYEVRVSSTGLLIRPRTKE